MKRSPASTVLAATAAAAFLLTGCSHLPDFTPHKAQVPTAQARAPAPTPAPTSQMVVAAANPYAAEAGMAVLRRGGSAVDAAVAIQAVLGLVEPQSSGLGGGAFMLVYDAKTGKIHGYDGRETAPSGATPQLFLDEAGKPLPFSEAVISGRATGAPGAVALLALAHKQHGKLPWAGLFTDAKTLADDGFTVSPRLARFLRQPFPQTSRPDVKAYFSRPDGSWLQAGDVLKNPAYAATLRKIAAEGAEGFYSGPVADAIVAKVHEGPRPGALSTADLAAYRARTADPVCRPFRAYVVCVPAPPSSGAALLEQLGILEHTDISSRGPNDPRAWFELGESSRLMYADRDHYFGDPSFVNVPVAGLLDPKYVAGRAARIGERAAPAPTWGVPRGAPVQGKDKTLEPGGTSHFVVVDRWGNVVSMTTSVESFFGTGRMAAGFFLNNQLTDFSFSPYEEPGVPAANAVAPGKRPRSSMSPVIVLDRSGKAIAALGSPGGTAILEYNAKTLIGVLDWNLSMQQAIALPNLIGKGDGFRGEVSRFPPEVLSGLKTMGVDVQPGTGEDSGLHGVILRDGRWEGGADPRREGVVLVD